MLPLFSVHTAKHTQDGKSLIRGRQFIKSFTSFVRSFACSSFSDLDTIATFIASSLYAALDN